MSYLWLCLLLSFPVVAETLEAVEVRASKKSSDFTFSGFQKIDSDEIEKNSLPLLTPVLENVPGVITNQNGGPGGRVSFFMRGTESRHTSFTIDSLRMNDTSNPDRQFDAAFLTGPFFKDITVYKGPQAVLFGSDAFGGLIDLQTRKGDSAPEGRVNLSGGSFGTVALSIGQDWKLRRNQGTVTALRMRTDGISRLNKKRFFATEKDGSEITQVMSSSRHGWDENGKVETDVLASYLRGKSQLDGFTDDNIHDHSANDQYTAQQKTTLRLDAKNSVSLRTGFNRHQRFINTLSSGLESYGGNYFQQEGLYDLKLKKVHLLAGAGAEQESFDSYDFDLNSVFAQSVFKVSENLSLQGGVRRDHHSRYGEFKTGSGGLALNISKHVLSLQYSQGFKAPSLYQLYAPPFQGTPIGNLNLTPEKNTSIEANWKWVSDVIDGEVALFQNQLSNLITYTNTGYINQDNFTVQGVEASGKIKLNQFVVTPSFTHQKFKYNRSTVLRRPLNVAGLNVSYFVSENQEVFTRVRSYSARKDTNSGSVTKLNPYQTVDLGWKLVRGKFDFGIQVLNVFNREYEELYGFSVMPRAVFGSVGFRY